MCWFEIYFNLLTNFFGPEDIKCKKNIYKFFSMFDTPLPCTHSSSCPLFLGCGGGFGEFDGDVGEDSCKKNSTANDSDLDSVTLKAYKVKDCGRNLGSDNCIWDAKHLFVASSAFVEVTKGKKEEFCAKKYQVKLKI